MSPTTKSRWRAPVTCRRWRSTTSTASTPTILRSIRTAFATSATAATATLNIPVWHWGATQSKVKQAELQRHQAQVELSAAQRQALADLQSFYAEAQTARGQLDILRNSVDLAAESLRLTTLRYQAGEATALEVVDAQNTLTAGAQQLSRRRGPLSCGDRQPADADGSLLTMKTHRRRQALVSALVAGIHHRQPDLCSKKEEEAAAGGHGADRHRRARRRFSRSSAPKPSCFRTTRPRSRPRSWPR